MTILRSDITKIAWEYHNVPWRHMGRDKSGVDCVGLVIAIWRDLGFEVPDTLPIYRTQPDGTMLSYFRRYMKPVHPRRIKDGSVVVYAFQNSPYHVGVVLDAERRSIMHALTSKRKVVVDMLDHGQNQRKLISAWDYPGVIDG